MNINKLEGVSSVYARRLSGSYDFGNIFACNEHMFIMDM